MNAMEQPIFILGVGAQKAGTSWFHAQLTRCPRVNMGALKEYHVWDARFVELAGNFLFGRDVGTLSSRALRATMQWCDGAYERYFARLIDGDTRWTGDITPSYSMLRAEHFRAVKARLENAGFSVKVVFFMREPVERNWSALRMHRRQQSQRGIRMSE